MGRRRGGLAGQLQPSVAESVGRIAGLPLMLVGPVPDAESGRPVPLPNLTRT